MSQQQGGCPWFLKDSQDAFLLKLMVQNVINNGNDSLSGRALNSEVT